MFINKDGIDYIEGLDKCVECNNRSECKVLISLINMGKSKIYKGNIRISSCGEYSHSSFWEDIRDEVADADELEEIPY